MMNNQTKKLHITDIKPTNIIWFENMLYVVLETNYKNNNLIFTCLSKHDLFTVTYSPHLQEDKEILYDIII